MKTKISITISEKVLGEIDGLIDNIYIRNRSQAIELLINNALGENRTAVILCGGPAESLLLPDGEYRMTSVVSGQRMIEHTIRKLREEGFRSIYIIGRHAVVTRIFSIVQNGSRYGAKIEYLEEQASSGTADSLRLIRGLVHSSFLVVYGDIFINQINLEELWNTHIRNKGISTLMLTTTATPSKKGIVKIEGSTILEFEQKPKVTDIFLGFSSIFAAQPELLEYHGQSLENDVFPVLAKKRILFGHMSANKELHVHSKADLKRLEEQISPQSL